MNPKSGIFLGPLLDKKFIFALRFRRFRANRVKNGVHLSTRQHAYIHIHIYIYIYAAGCLKEPQILTPIARNMRKRSAKCVFFLKKSTQFWLPRFAVLLSTHDFVPIFFLICSPLFSGGTWVLLWSWCPELRETRGGTRVA